MNDNCKIYLKLYFNCINNLIVNNKINDCKPYYQKVKDLNCLLE
jgi:hypothetical protein